MYATVAMDRHGHESIFARLSARRASDESSPTRKVARGPDEPGISREDAI